MNLYRKILSKKSKATSVFWMGPVAEFKDKDILYQFCVFENGIELNICHKNIKNDKSIIIKGKKFKQFVKQIKEWLKYTIEINQMEAKNERSKKEKK